MIELLGLGFGIWFILYSIAFLSLGIYVSYFENFAISVTFLTIMSIVGWYFFAFGPLAWLIANPALIIPAFLVYVGIGCLYAVLRVWPKYLDRNKKYIIKDYEEWLNSTHYNKEKHTSYDAYMNSHSFKYSAWNHKDYISSSILLWGWTVLWDIIESPITWIYNNVYLWVSNALNAITARKVSQFIDKSKSE